MATATNFLSGFLQGFGQMAERNKTLKQQDEERKARLKLYEIQLQREQAANASSQQQMDARSQLLGMLGGGGGPAAAPPNGIPDSQGPVAPQGGAPMSLTQLLADPKAAMLLLQSGFVKADDIIKQEQTTTNRAMLEKFLGGGGVGAGGNSPGMEMTGLKVGPSGELMPDFGLPQVTSPQTVMGPNGPELATFNPRSGARVATLGTPKPDTVTPDTAGRISGLKQAEEIAQTARDAFIRPDGSVNRQLILTSFGRIPKTEGRKIRDDLAIAVDSVLRARTGAGVNVEEMKQVVDQFLPSPLDGDAEVVNKMNRLQQFIGGALDTVTLPPSVQKRLGSGNSSKVVDFNSLPP